MLKIVLLGGGNVAHHLFAQFSKNSEIELVQWYNRSISAIQKFESTTLLTNQLADLKPADIYIIAVSDSVIREGSSSLPFKDRLRSEEHTSELQSRDELVC